MPFDGDKREVRVNYVCKNCRRQGIGFETEVYHESSHRWSREFLGTKSIPQNWRKFGMDTYLCDRCVDDPKAQNVAKEDAKWNAIGGLGCVVILLIIAGVCALVR